MLGLENLTGRKTDKPSLQSYPENNLAELRGGIHMLKRSRRIGKREDAIDRWAKSGRGIKADE
jgi:hypothetical protein